MARSMAAYLASDNLSAVWQQHRACTHGSGMALAEHHHQWRWHHGGSNDSQRRWRNISGGNVKAARSMAKQYASRRRRMA